MGDAIDISFFRELLEKKRDELLVRRDQHLDAAGTVELDQARVGRLSRMDALQQQALAKAAGQRSDAELKRIQSALARIGSGEYGVCLDCGEDIAAKRLMADPGAPICVTCAGIREGR